MEKTKGSKRMKEEAMAMDAVQARSNNDHKSLPLNLYACSIEYNQGKVAYVIDAIRLSDLLSCSCSNLDARCHNCDPGCGVLGTQIIFAGGEETGEEVSRGIYVFETSDHQAHPKIQGGLFAKFQAGKSEPILEEVCGKLYALSSPPPFGDPKFSSMVQCL